MAISFNKVILVGRLTRDPEIRSTVSGTRVANFSLAVDRGYRKNENSDSVNTDFFRIVAFNTLADFASTYLKKGRLVLVEGSLRINKYKDKNDISRESVEVWASSVTFMESKKDNAYTDGYAEITNSDINVEQASHSSVSYGNSKKIESIDDDIISNDIPEFDIFNDLKENIANDDKPDIGGGKR
ncbi:MAG TPA: single-stranded DNA-binding protein [Petrotogaceae bacterium]|nr:single-stranded DNA-binding protein [Petrotogaceae bacterium]HOG34441.1 single-stranded DNA-binding protein [Petrotogaceae bacterium]HPO26578.1 single-stranded DNA-binding protein [Petrotogaceae bacterium]HPX15709.1 single-stranded DNA-binding protein [Petrotogaceae bacterium]HQC39749.1 single-stranded DNA-binding protein [Petrotogaceae bacterium]